MSRLLSPYGILSVGESTSAPWYPILLGIALTYGLCTACRPTRGRKLTSTQFHPSRTVHSAKVYTWTVCNSHTAQMGMCDWCVARLFDSAFKSYSTYLNANAKTNFFKLVCSRCVVPGSRFLGCAKKLKECPLEGYFIRLIDL